MPASLKAAQEATMESISVPLQIASNPEPEAISIQPDTPVIPECANKSAKSLEKTFS